MNAKWIVACPLVLIALSLTAQVAKPAPPAPAPSGRAPAAQAAATAPSTPASPGRALMAKVINALGGKKVVLSIKTVRTKEKRETITPDGLFYVDAELTTVFPDRVHVKTETVDAGDPKKTVSTRVVVLVSGTGFVSAGGTVQDLSPQACEEMRRAIQFDVIPVAQHTGDPNYTFVVLGSEKIGGVTTFILNVTADGYSTRWNVDPVSGRVLRATRMTRGADGAAFRTTFEYSDWRIVDGVTLPSRIIENGATSSVIEIRSLEINPEIRWALFEKPGSGPAPSPQGEGPDAGAQAPQTVAVTELPVAPAQEVQGPPREEPPTAPAKEVQGPPREEPPAAAAKEVQGPPREEPPAAPAQEAPAAPQGEPPTAAAQESQATPQGESPTAAAQIAQAPPNEERPAAPAQVAPYGFRRTRWGMTRAQVMATERGRPVRDKDIQHLHVVDYEDVVAGLGCRVIYIFVRDQLVRAKYTFEERHVNKNLFLDDFDTLTSALAKKYGKPTLESVNWSDELYKKDSSQWGMAVAGGHMSKYTTYDLPETRITASLTGDNFQVSVEIEYVSKALESLEDSARADEDKDKL